MARQRNFSSIGGGIAGRNQRTTCGYASNESKRVAVEGGSVNSLGQRSWSSLSLPHHRKRMGQLSTQAGGPTVGPGRMRDRLFGMAGTAEVERLLAKDGWNELNTEKPKTLLSIIFGVLTEPMFLLLLGGAILYFILGEWKEAMMLLFFVLFIIALTIYEERKTENALAALKKLASPRSLVVRDKVAKRIPSRELVRGDIVGVYEGDRIPADGILLEGLNLSVDESILTGESFPVSKSQIDNPVENNDLELPAQINAHEQAAHAATVQHPAADPATGVPQGFQAASAAHPHRASPFLYSGTLVVRGQGVMQVKATGPRTEFGRIGKMLSEVKQEKTPLEKETRRLVLNMLVIGMILCVAVTVLYGLTAIEPTEAGPRWLKGFLAGIALAMALLPEEFPVVLTVFMALGSWRIGQRKVLTRRPQAIETLGACTVLCTDKTGTLTMNKMELRLLKPVGGQAVYADPNTRQLPEEVHTLLEYAVLASQQNAFDPMDIAVKGLASQDPTFAEHLHANWSMLREYPPDEMMAISRVWAASETCMSPDGTSSGEPSLMVACKGAPESIADLCHLPKAQWEALREEIKQYAQQGLRLLAVAHARFLPPSSPPSPRLGDALPPRQHDFDFVLSGLLGFHDPIRPEVPDAVATCHRAGMKVVMITRMKVVMITGDMPETATKIAREVGITNPNYLTGAQITEMSDSELRARVSNVEIFARVRPEQKLKLVQAFKANGEITAMTGDGVNDSPALKAADIGIAMGERGTDVAREAAHLVLLDDSFSSIVAACQLGRRIFDNLTKAMGYIVIVHIPFAGLALFPILFRWPMMLYPVHIVFSELVIDPCCSIVFEMETEEPDILLRAPRNIKKSMVGLSQLLLYSIQGCGILGSALLVYWWQTANFTGEGHAHSQALAISFGILVIGNLGTVMTNRSQYYSAWYCLKRPNRAVWIVCPIALVALFLVIYVPGLQDMFHFASLDIVHVAIFLGAGLVTPVGYEIYKFFLRRLHTRRLAAQASRELNLLSQAPSVQALRANAAV
ncbi:ion-transporting P-type ATPase [Paratrimastix pyriformis]|uniref:Ion-transporting P-type ATPase n=1 Tax=Paratrimastix pyriformis TaxID=342808 RepID=A0ABQ8UD79_9EUKA|nr:ion-transporting P-type ATPase [Paratrimastix pyriformis]